VKKDTLNGKRKGDFKKGKGQQSNLQNKKAKTE